MEKSYASLSDHIPNLVMHPAALFCLAVFVLSFIGVLFEEKTHMRKSKPVLFGASIIWVTIAVMVKCYGADQGALRQAVNHTIGEYGSLLIFLLSAMTYISVLQERNVFHALRSRLVRSGYHLRQLFWITGILGFFLSAIADNLTTALVMGAVIMAVGKGNQRFIALACINVVNAANAGGSFSPFGDITTLMVWQAEKVGFFGFFALFIPACVCFFVPALIMSFYVPKERPAADSENVTIKPGGKLIILLGLLTIAAAVSLEQFLRLPPFMGMMLGMSVLMLYGWYLQVKMKEDFDILDLVSGVEWDTLLFFFGVLFSVGGLAFLGYLEIASTAMYSGMGASAANIMLGVVSALIDNIPVMFAVLSMHPDMDQFQWLLITFTTGVGGSLLSIGSAAGVALMGVARGQYTFSSHMKWMPVLALGYAAAIGTHFLVNH